MSSGRLPEQTWAALVLLCLTAAALEGYHRSIISGGSAIILSKQLQPAKSAERTHPSMETQYDPAGAAAVPFPKPLET